MRHKLSSSEDKINKHIEVWITFLYIFYIMEKDLQTLIDDWKKIKAQRELNKKRREKVIEMRAPLKGSKLRKAIQGVIFEISPEIFFLDLLHKKWEKILEPKISKHSKPYALNKGTLVLQTENSTASRELLFHTDLIKIVVNTYLGAICENKIKELYSLSSEELGEDPSNFLRKRLAKQIGFYKAKIEGFRKLVEIKSVKVIHNRPKMRGFS